FGWPLAPLVHEHINDGTGHFEADSSNDIVARLRDINREDTLLYRTFDRGQPTTSNDMLVRALYRTFLAREPDPTGLRVGTQLLQDGSTPQEVIGWLLRSDEFGARHKEFLRRYVRREFLTG